MITQTPCAGVFPGQARDCSSEPVSGRYALAEMSLEKQSCSYSRPSDFARKRLLLATGRPTWTWPRALHDPITPSCARPYPYQCSVDLNNLPAMGLVGPGQAGTQVCRGQSLCLATVPRRKCRLNLWGPEPGSGCGGAVLGGVPRSLCPAGTSSWAGGRSRQELGRPQLASVPATAASLTQSP